MSGRQSNLTDKEMEDLNNIVTDTLANVCAIGDDHLLLVAGNDGRWHEALPLVKTAYDVDKVVEELEWVSASTNVKHAVSMGLFHITEDKNSWKLTEENALETLSNAILEGNSIVISPRDFGVYKSAFQKVEVE